MVATSRWGVRGQARYRVPAWTTDLLHAICSFLNHPSFCLFFRGDVVACSTVGEASEEESGAPVFNEAGPSSSLCTIFSSEWDTQRLKKEAPKLAVAGANTHNQSHTHTPSQPPSHPACHVEDELILSWGLCRGGLGCQLY